MVEHQCYQLVDGVLLGEPEQVDFASRALVIAGVPFAERARYFNRATEFDQQHLKDALLAVASSTVVENWSYFGAIAEISGQDSRWLRFLAGVSTVECMRYTGGDYYEAKHHTEYLRAIYRYNHSSGLSVAYQTLQQVGRGALYYLKDNILFGDQTH